MKRKIFILLLLLMPVIGFSQSKGLKYQWRKISGPEGYRIESPDSAVTNITDLEAGIYRFELKVTNSRGLSARDTMVLTVNPASNALIKRQVVLGRKNHP